MTAEPSAAPSKPPGTGTSLRETIFAIGHALAGLDPGPLAELRRMSLDGDDIGAPYFWRLVSRHGLHGANQANWARILQMMTILTAKGRTENKPSPHSASDKANGYRGLGTALCDGGDPSWPPKDSPARPVFSELRLARLLAARGDTRADLMERAVRMLAAKKPDGTGVDCADIAAFLLRSDDPDPARRIAKDYYDRLDRALRKSDADTNTASAPGDDDQ